MNGGAPRKMSRETDRLRLHSFAVASEANGPGVRAVIWLQGCTLGCLGCCNPHSLDPSGGTWVSLAEISRRVLQAKGIEGVTISGGEPLQQLPALLTFLDRIRRYSLLSVVLFTGYTWREVQKLDRGSELTSLVDVVLAGRYDRRRRVPGGLLGSQNKQLLVLSNRYTREDFVGLPDIEISVSAQGCITSTGSELLEIEGAYVPFQYD